MKIIDREKLQATAASLAAEDELSDSEIARLCGITRRTLMRWKKQPAIQQKIDEHLQLSKQQSEAQMISERQKRIADMDIRWRDLQDIIPKRARSPEMEGVPGGSTGLLRRRKASFSQRHGGLAVYNYQVDTALLRELRRLEVAAAKALATVRK
jgi:hypothetical protein